MEQTDPPTFLDLPRELLHHVLIECSPSDAAAVRSTCKALKHAVDGDKLLYRDLYLQTFDPPPDDGSWSDLSAFETAVKAYTATFNVLQSASAEKKLNALPHSGPELIRLVKHAKPPDTPFLGSSRNLTLLNRIFKDESNREALLARSSLYAWAHKHGRQHFLDEDASQLSAKLHVFYGAPLPPSDRTPSEMRMDKYARSRVYDLRRYTRGSFWGPFHNDGSARVDWEKVQAVMLVVQYNLNQFHERTSKRFPLLWHTPWAGIAPRSFVSPTDWRQRKRERDAQAEENGIERDEEARRQEVKECDLRDRDPYNITGTWMRVVCFLDYSDLHSFNFDEPTPEDDEPRPPLDQEEAIRLITMKLKVTKLHPAGEGHFPGSLVAHFEGTSRSMHVGWDPNANSGIREWQLKGTVSTTPEGEVRWTSFSVFHGEERWRSEGVQIGGSQSARGVWGSWFDKDFDTEGPAGPTAFWKLTDELPPHTENRTTTTIPSASYHPLFVNNGQPHDHRHAQHGAIGVFGAAASPSEDDNEDDTSNDHESHTSPGLARDVDLGADSADDAPIEEQHPYNQVIMTGDDSDEDDQEILLEFEEEADEDGEARTVTMPASEILHLLNNDSSSEDDEDYQPPAEGAS